MSKSPSLRRIQADIRELALDPSDRYYAHPLEHDMFEWHFTIRGADETDFEGGVYHGRILLPPEYPFKPPHIIFMTRSGRFETNKKVCLSFSAYHPELWQPAWGIRLILEALISFMPTPADGAVGALDWSPQERKRLAKLSRDFCCPTCGKIIDLLPKVDPNKKKESNNNRFSKEIEKLQQLQQMAEGKKEEDKKENGDVNSEKKEAVADSKEESSAEPSQTEEEEDQKPSSAPSDQSPTDSFKRRDTNNSAVSAESSVQVETMQEDENEAAEESVGLLERAQANAAAAAQENPHALHDAHGANQIEANIEVLEGASTLHWVYDPLLNLMIVLLGVVCWLLWQKYIDLREELASLREQNLLLE